MIMRSTQIIICFFLMQLSAFANEDYQKFKEKFTKVSNPYLIDGYTMEYYKRNEQKYNKINYQDVVNHFVCDQVLTFSFQDTSSFIFRALSRYNIDEMDFLTFFYYEPSYDGLEVYICAFSKDGTCKNIDMIAFSYPDSLKRTNRVCMHYLDNIIQYDYIYSNDTDYIETLSTWRSVSSSFGIGGSVIYNEDTIARRLFAKTKRFSMVNLCDFSSDTLRENKFDSVFFHGNNKLLPSKFIFQLSFDLTRLISVNHFPLNKKYNCYLIDCCRLDTNKFLLVFKLSHEKDKFFDNALQVSYHVVNNNGNTLESKQVASYLSNNKLERKEYSSINIRKNKIKVETER